MGQILIVSAILFMHALPALASRATRNIQREQEGSEVPSVTWSSPSGGQVLTAGETLVGAWSSTDAVQSPLFSLCLARDSSGQSDGDVVDDSCGENIDPEVTQMDSGFSTMTLTVPTVASTGSYWLRMVDGNGNEFDSPVFILTPSDASDAEETTPAVSVPTPATTATPLLTIPHSQRIASSSAVTSSAVVVASPGSTPAFTAPTIVPTVVNLRAHPQPSTLALAIPLSLIGATIFAALLLCCAKWRRSARKRARSPDGYTLDTTAYPFAGYGAPPSLGPSQDLEKAVNRLSAVAQMRSSRLSGSFVHPQLSMLGSRAGSECLSDKYTLQPERSRRTSRVRGDGSLSATTPYPSRLLAQRSLSMPSVESFPVDYADYSQPIASAPQPMTRRARSNGNVQTPFVQRQVYSPPSVGGRRDRVEYDAADDIVDSYMQDSPPASPAMSGLPAEPPRMARKPRSRPQSGDSLAYRLQSHSQDVEGQYSGLGTDVYRIVSKRVQQHF